MNSVVDSFDQILEFARKYGLAMTKKRAILREYLQTKILDAFYQEKESVNFCFVGGTSLRLLRGLDRFSEDLDFDRVGGSDETTKLLMSKVYKRLTRENLEIDFYRNTTSKRAYYEFRFKNMLAGLRIGDNKEEKLVIKFDFENHWKGQRKEAVLLNKYGFLVNVMSIPVGQILVQKLQAYLQRSDTQPRDIYDAAWLLSNGAEFDRTYANLNGVPADVVARAEKKFAGERRRLKTFKAKLEPFLINENYVWKLDLLGQLLSIARNG